MTDELRKKLPPLYSQEKVKDPIVHAKYFKMGYFSLSELESVRVSSLQWNNTKL